MIPGTGDFWNGVFHPFVAIEQGLALTALAIASAAASPAAAVTGQGVFTYTGPMSHLRALASLFPEPVHIVVREDSDIVQIADLDGRREAAFELVPRRGSGRRQFPADDLTAQVGL